MYLCRVNINRYKGLLEYFKNRYILALTIFGVWMIAFDRNDVFTHYKYYHEKKQLERDTAYYRKEIELVKSDLMQLSTNKAELEKIAREKYYMKRDNEDIFIIEEED
jgi:cell division protein DivIC